MSKPIFEDLFLFEGRRNRKSYFLYLMTVSALSTLLSIVLVPIALGTGGIGMALFALYLPIAVSAWAVGSQRCRDFGWTGWIVLISAVPLIGFVFALALLFVPGTIGANMYGDDPLGQPELIVV
ncbi:DUF805 domain-containing protein [Pseudopelagicola sp. nBUS_19]|uniref:DUF805 domain-containing protein n=1 Tax=Pseudopelagicola sp. nBUS_19 TaxID=3395316 RepID=UPI003EBCAE3C